MAFTRRTVTIESPSGGGDVALLDFGDPTRPIDVVFSHANGFNAMTHRQALEPLADRLRIVAIDQRGHGRTRLPTEPEGRESWFGLVDDLIAVVAALGLTRPAVFAGHSMGGTISLLAAERLGPLSKALLLCDPVVPPVMHKAGTPHHPGIVNLITMTQKRRSRFANKEEALAGYGGRGIFKTWSEAALADYLEDGLEPAPEGGVRLSCDPAWEASNFGAQSQPTREVLLATTRPTRVLRAEHHTTCWVAPDDDGVKANPLLDVSIIPGASHMLPVERPDLVREGLLALAAL